MNFLRVKRLHFVGIGGIGMSGLAELLKSVGLEVTGSDHSEGETVTRLRGLGIPVFQGHRAENILGADVVVYSSAVRDANPEVAAARAAGVPVIKRAEMLAEVMRVKRGIAVAGTHGKTTTTSMTGAILMAAGLDPTIIVGGRMREVGTARLGRGEYLVAEADEFDRSFLALSPMLTVVNNIDLEHLDTYRDLQDLQETFARFARSVPFFGAAILGLDDPNVQEIRPLVSRRVVTFGLTPQADVTVRDLSLERTGSRFVAFADRDFMGPVALQIPGLHNVKNALAALAVARELSIPFPTAARALADFRGVIRRFEKKGERRGAVVIDDYAHHPTEVAATLAAARQSYPDRRIVALFQPHLYSRTKDMAAAFGAAFLNADVLLVAPVYGSREAPREGVTGALVADAATARGHRAARFIADRGDIARVLDEEVRDGDLLLTMGAGDVNQFGEEFLREKKEGEEILRAKEGAGNVAARPVADAPPPPTPSKKSSSSSSSSESESKSRPGGSGRS
ncbi:MAG TPA: UDP-N-acetylmuramate--L-alanine ligase [Thermoanaerobaculia bacterium]|nr:UDP-N-acetylmuramate--L-alanine ligase [Thermoanaerobaculia bacterium]